jgi:hypothetical protein
MRTREDLVQDESDVRVRMLREAVERTAAPSEYKKYLLLDVIETYLPVPEDERERWEKLLSREENRAVRDFERTWAERLLRRKATDPQTTAQHQVWVSSALG